MASCMLGRREPEVAVRLDAMRYPNVSANGTFEALSMISSSHLSWVDSDPPALPARAAGTSASACACS